MAIYNAVFFLFAFLSFYELFCTKRVNKKAFIPFIMVLLVVLGTVRGGAYGDYYAYKDVFENYTVTNEFLVSRNFVFEPIYSLVQLACKLISNNFIFFEFILALITMLSQHFFAKSYGDHARLEADNVKSEGSYYFTVMFFLWGLYKCNILFIRSSIALVICLNAIKYIQRRDFKRFLLVVLLAAGFHYSALIFLPAYFIYNWHAAISKKLVYFFIALVVLLFSFSQIVELASKLIGGNYGLKLSRYLDMNGVEYGVYSTGSSSVVSLLLKIVLNIGILLIAGIYLLRRDKDNKELEGYFNLYATGCVLYIASLLDIGYAFARLSIFYNIAQIPMLMPLFVKQKEYGVNRFAFWCLFTIYLYARFFVNSINQPYVFFWQ